jgi:hypothetical protein
MGVFSIEGVPAADCDTMQSWESSCGDKVSITAYQWGRCAIACHCRSFAVSSSHAVQRTCYYLIVAAVAEQLMLATAASMQLQLQSTCCTGGVGAVCQPLQRVIICRLSCSAVHNSFVAGVVMQESC